MPTPKQIQVPVSSVFDPVGFPEESLGDSLSSQARRQRLLTELDEAENDVISKSWPPVMEHRLEMNYAVREELEILPDGDDSNLPESPTMSLSPAAAFLSSFCSSEPIPPPPDESGQTIAGYVLGPTIGVGGFSTIKEAKSPSGGIVAVKIVRHNAFDSLPVREKARQRYRLSREARVWVSLSHENILPLFDSHYTQEAMYLVTLYCPTGTLFHILQREGTPALEQTDAGCMFRQVVKALQYMHETMGLVHGDVKLENVLVDETGVCRLADFGLTRRIGGEADQASSGEEDGDEELAFDMIKQDPAGIRRSETVAGPSHLPRLRHGLQHHRYSEPQLPTAQPSTQPAHEFQPGSLPYAAPELLLPCMHEGGSHYMAHPAQDMWALGVLLYTLLTGSYPFHDPFEPRLQMKILRGMYDVPSDIGPYAESVLSGCLEKEVPNRWDIHMVDDAAWGIGYGVVNISPALSEEQRSQLCTRSPLPTLDADSLNAAMTSCSITSQPHSPFPRSQTRSIPRGRTSAVSPNADDEANTDMHSQSRSASPINLPRTPDDDGAVDYFSGSRRKRDPSAVRFFIQGDEETETAKWQMREVFYGEGTGKEKERGRVRREPFEEDAVEIEARGRQDGASGKSARLELRKKSQSRTRSWSMNC